MRNSYEKNLPNVRILYTLAIVISWTQFQLLSNLSDAFWWISYTYKQCRTPNGKSKKSSQLNDIRTVQIILNCKEEDQTHKERSGESLDCGQIREYKGFKKLPQKDKKLGDNGQKLLIHLHQNKYKSSQWLLNSTLINDFFPTLLFFSYFLLFSHTT